jgi:hypothetical protein
MVSQPDEMVFEESLSKKAFNPAMAVAPKIITLLKLR